MLFVSGAGTGATRGCSRRSIPFTLTQTRNHVRIHGHSVEELTKTRGKIYGPDGAAALLGLKATTLSSKVHRAGLKKFVA
jgi:hypothetical protein